MQDIIAGRRVLIFFRIPHFRRCFLNQYVSLNIKMMLRVGFVFNFLAGLDSCKKFVF